MARPRRDITGQKFGRLTVMAEDSGGKNPKVKCQCSCGKVVMVLKHGVIRGYTRSCGCLRSESVSIRRRSSSKPKNNPTPSSLKFFPVSDFLEDDDDLF